MYPGQLSLEVTNLPVTAEIVGSNLTIAQMNLFFGKEKKKREEINESIAEMSQTVVDLKRAFVETHLE